MRGWASAQPVCGWGLVGRGPGGDTSPLSRAAPVRHLERVLGQRARPPPARPCPAQPSPARPGPGHLRRPSPWLAGCTVGQEPGWRCRGQTSGRIPPRGDRRQIRGARPGGVGLDRGALSRCLLQRRSPVHCRGDMRYDFCLKPLGPARPRPHSGTTPSVRPLTSPSRPSLRLARGGGGLADSRRCWHRARSPGWPKGRWHLSVPLSCEDK